MKPLLPTLISALLFTSLPTTVMATDNQSSHYIELKAELKALKDAKDPNINKVYEKLHLITSDGYISDKEKQELKLLIDSNKKQLASRK